MENDKTPLGKAQANKDRFMHAMKRSHEKFISKYDETHKFVFPYQPGNNGSLQWEAADLANLKKSGRPALTINKIKPTLMSVLGEYLQGRTEVKFVPSAGGTPEIAQALTKLYIHISKEQNLSKKELTLVTDALISSRAYYDVRIGFDDNFMGEVRVSVPNAKNIIPDPDADSDDPDDWNDVIAVRHLTIQDIEDEYGKKFVSKVKVHGDSAENAYKDEFNLRDSFGEEDNEYHEGHQDKTTRKLYMVIERQFKSLESVPFFINVATGDERRVPADWAPEEVQAVLEADENITIERKRSQVIRWVASCGSVLLHDEISPYSFFTIIPYFPMFRRGTTSGIVEDLIDPQRNYNKLRSQELHIVNGTANAGWKVKRGSLHNLRADQLEVEGSKTGLVLEISGDMGDVERIQPAQIPQGLDRISSKADADLGAISGIQDEARGVARADVAGRAINARREAILTSLGSYFENLKFTREMLAKRILKLVQKYYDEQRTLVITTGGLNPQSEELVVNEPDPATGQIRNDLTLGEYTVAMTSTAARDSYQLGQFEELKQMQELGISIPSYMFVEASSLDRKEELAEELKQAAGTSTPTEEERQVQQEMQQLEMEEKRASIMARKAQAMLSQARAEKVISEIERGELDDTKLEELALKARALDNERFRDEQSMSIRQRAQEAQEAKLLLDDDYRYTQLQEQMWEKEKEQQMAAAEPAQKSDNS